MKFSLIIPTKNSADSLVKVLEGIRNAETQPYEVIVVDDGSTDHTKEVVKDFQVTYLPLFANFGAAYARNYGASKAMGDVFVFIDADIIPCRNFLSIIQEELELGYGGVGGRYLEYNPSNNTFHRLASLHEEILFQELGSRKEMTIVCGGLCAFKKEAWYSKSRTYLENRLFFGMASGEDAYICEEISLTDAIIYRSDLTGIHITDYSKRYFKRMFNQGYSRTTNILNRSFKRINKHELSFHGVPMLLLGHISLFVFLVSQFFPSLVFSFFCYLYAISPKLNRISLADYPLMLKIFFLQQTGWAFGVLHALAKPLLLSIRRKLALVESAKQFLLDGSMSKLFFFVTNRCNMTCSWCLDANRPEHNKGASASTELKYEEILKITKQSKEQISYLIITGGEPFLRNDLDQIVHAFYSH